MLYFLIIISITGNEILQKADSIMNAPEDREEKLTTIVIDKDGTQKERETIMFEKGNMRLLRFLSPAEDRGIGFLSISDELMYIYLPAFNKIRRIASHVKKENFQDTDFSYDDLGTSNYLEKWDAEIEVENDSIYIIILNPKKDKEEYSKLIMTVKKDKYLIKNIEFLKDGKLIKTLLMKDYKKVDSYWVAAYLEMKTSESNHKTIMKIEDIKFDQNLSDDVFTKRNLKKF